MILQPVLELLIIFPAALLCFLAVGGHLRIRVRTLVLTLVPVLLLFCTLGGGLCWYLEWSSNALLLPFLIPAAVFYCRALTLSVWKSISIFLGVCGVFSCLSGLPVAADALLCPGSVSPWLCPAASLIHLTLGFAIVGLCGYPATHAVHDLLRTERIVRTWYVFWILPVTIFLFNLIMLPRQGELLRGRLLRVYALLSLLMIGLLLLFYLLFYLMARELNANADLRQENQFLHMQTSQYNALRASIAETRQARHDLRHHFLTLSALAERGAWDELRRYLKDAGDSVPAAELSLCENQAVDGVAGYYAALSRRDGVPFSCRLDLPQALPVSEMDLCVALSNLLENALEASRRADGRRYISLQASLHAGKLVLLTVENAYSGELAELDGALQSTKRRGEGVGLQSVAHIADKNGGYCKFLCGDGVFTANVMLRGG